MRLGVLDVGSNTVHFLVIDALQGGRPLPVFSHKAELHLGDHLVEGNRLSASVTRQLRAFVDEALQIAEDKGVEELLAFATSAIRDAAHRLREFTFRSLDRTGFSSPSAPRSVGAGSCNLRCNVRSTRFGNTPPRHGS